MTDVLEVLNRRAAVDAVHAEAARIGADGDALLDSKAFYSQVTSLDPDAPGYRRQVQELVAAAAPRREPTGSAAPEQAAGSQQWDMEKVARSSSDEITTAWDAGLLRDLGYGQRQRR